MSLAEACAFDFSQFGLTDWQFADNGLVNNGTLRIIGPCISDFTKSKAAIEILDGGSKIEWRFAPSQHIGALTPQLLYRSGNRTLANSFLSVAPTELTGTISDADIVARMFSPDAAHPKMRHVYQGWVIARLTNFNSADFYLAAIYRNLDDSSDVVSIWRIVSGSSRVKLGAKWLGNKIDWSKPWNCRFNLVGSALKAKWWSCDVIEPEDWDIHSIDHSHMRPGMIGFASTVHGDINANVWGLDWYAWSLNPESPAPLYPSEIAG